MIRLLICEDSESLRIVLRTMLGSALGDLGRRRGGRRPRGGRPRARPLAGRDPHGRPHADPRRCRGDARDHNRPPECPDRRFTGSDDRAVVGAMLEAGATGYCVKGSPLRSWSAPSSGPRSRRPTGADARRGGRPRRDPRRRQSNPVFPAGAGGRSRLRPAGAAEPHGPQPRLGPDHPTRVLVVDDDERLRILLRTTLEVIDIEIDEAATVPAAWARITENRPDVVVLDLRLPGPDGLTPARRQGDPDPRHRHRRSDRQRRGHRLGGQGSRGRRVPAQAVQSARPARGRRRACGRTLRRAVPGFRRTAAGGAAHPLRGGPGGCSSSSRASGP